MFVIIIFNNLFILLVSDGQPLLASGGSSGVISIWNLEKKRLQSVIREAHDSVITSLHFFANEPVLMSSSADNSIKVRIILQMHLCIHGLNFLPYIWEDIIFECNFRCWSVDSVQNLLV